MKVSIINDGGRSESTRHCLQLFLQEISGPWELEVRELILPKDVPHYCHGCNSCTINGEDTCPHYMKMRPIVEALIEADLIIMASSVSDQGKVPVHLCTLFDHLNYMSIGHRPDPTMFKKVALTVTTAVTDTGLNYITKVMKNNLALWGVRRIITYKKIIHEIRWEELSDKKSMRIRREIGRKADKIRKALMRGDKLCYPMIRRFSFIMMREMIKKNSCNLHDRNYWESQGWFGGNRPF